MRGGRSNHNTLRAVKPNINFTFLLYQNYLHFVKDQSCMILSFISLPYLFSVAYFFFKFLWLVNFHKSYCIVGKSLIERLLNFHSFVIVLNFNIPANGTQAKNLAITTVAS